MSDTQNQGDGAGFHHRYLELVAQIEARFAVSQWRLSDVRLWPLARIDLHSDLFWASVGAGPPRAPLTHRVATSLATPLTNLWNSRLDLSHHVARPSPAHAIVLGDGVSLDLVDGAWQDRFGEPLIEAFEQRGLCTFLMQGGRADRRPWRRPTFAANVIAVRGAIAARLNRDPAHLPDLQAVLNFLKEQGVAAPSLESDGLLRRGRLIDATATAFEHVLRKVRPNLAFVATYYAGLGPAFLLACRRQAILTVDLQHCPQGGAHKAYNWSGLPETGYPTLPAVFWTWTEADAAHIGCWADKLPAPWHRAVYGGHTQLAQLLNDERSQTRSWNAAPCEVGGEVFAREILIALQPIPGQRALWDAMAQQIEAAPPNWRWWIRRHPASTRDQDSQFGRLLALRGPTVIVEEASTVPLPALLRRMTTTISLCSGVAAEAATFGIPSLFLTPEAEAMFPQLLASGLASVAEPRNVKDEIERLPLAPARAILSRPPDLGETLDYLETIAPGYSQLCRSAAPSQPGPAGGLAGAFRSRVSDF